MPSEATAQLLSVLAGLWPTLPDGVKAAADARWPRGCHAWLGWPASQVMVIPSRRLLYVPIAKNACSSLKRLMVDLAGYPADDAVRASVHACLDFYATGLQLKDWPAADVARFLTEPGWFRFAVLRDPVERLVSAYVEKFVRNRLAPANQVHTGPVVSAVQGREPPDFERGITFREFVMYVANTPADRLDPHWRPQAACLPAGCIDLHRYDISQTEVLAEALHEHCGVKPVLPHDNVSRQGRAAGLVGVPDWLPAAFDGELAPEIDDFIDAPLRATLTPLRDNGGESPRSKNKPPPMNIP